MAHITVLGSQFANGWVLDRRAPFTYDAWNHPEVLAKVSEVAGIDLIPSIDFDIANINISWGDGTTTTEQSNITTDDGTSAVAWHYDSFPFVCVTMLSDCTGMVGGETALRTPNGDIMKVRGPAMVCPIPCPRSRCIATHLLILTNCMVGNRSSDARPLHRTPSPKSPWRP